jgi:hypothetical protein
MTGQQSLADGAALRPTPEQNDLLRHLGLRTLVDDDAVAERIRPR